MVRIITVILAVLLLAGGCVAFILLNPVIKEVQPGFVSFLAMTLAVVVCFLAPLGLLLYLLEYRKGEKPDKK